MWPGATFLSLPFMGQQWKYDIIIPNTALVTMIHHCSMSFDPVIKIRETTQLLELSMMEIYIVKNNYSANSTDTIIEKAERALKTRLKYQPLFNNCEHFCHECCVNSSESLQVNYALEVFWKVALSVYGYFIHNGYHSF